MEGGWEDIAGVVFVWRCQQPRASMTPGLQGSWSETLLLMEGPGSRHIVANVACGWEVVGEVGDVQPHGGDIWIEEVKVVVIAELDERLCL